MTRQDAEQQQSGNMLNELQGKKQVDGPDEPVVNEEEQNKAVNPGDEEQQGQTGCNEEKKGYSTGNEKQNDTEPKEDNNQNEKGRTT